MQYKRLLSKLFAAVVIPQVLYRSIFHAYLTLLSIPTGGFGGFAGQNKTFAAFSREPGRREATAGGLTLGRMQCMKVLSNLFVPLFIPEVAVYSLFNI